MYDLIEQTIDSDMKPMGNEIEFDFSTLKFIKPVGVTVLSNLVGRLKKGGSRISFVCPDPNRLSKRCPIAFLDDSMFFKHFLKHPIDVKENLRSTTLPLENVTYAGSSEYLIKVMQWLSLRLSLTKKSLGDIEMSIKEVFNNINDHSSENIGSSFIQHYPTKKNVMIAISDFGVGIPFNIQLAKPLLDDAAALKLSIQEGFTTKTKPGNLGAGLFTLLQNVVINNKGSVYIHSNRGILHCIYDENADKMNVLGQNVSQFYPGTLLEINFRTDTIENIEEEFSWD